MAIGSHQSSKMLSDEWLTPLDIIKSLGEFDLDPCSPINRPWDTAKHHFNILDDGLNQDWNLFKRIFMNPPYGKFTELWMKKLSDHGCGIALIFARTETRMFFNEIWPKADSILFIEGRLHFYRVDGTRALANSGAPSCLISYGEENVDAIADSGIRGKHLLINSIPFIVVGSSPSWKNVIQISLTNLSGPAHIQEIYEMVERVAPDKVQNNLHYKEKIRQQLQKYFTRISVGVYQK